jgi:hypothetical protein
VTTAPLPRRNNDRVRGQRPVNGNYGIEIGGKTLCHGRLSRGFDVAEGEVFYEEAGKCGLSTLVIVLICVGAAVVVGLLVAIVVIVWRKTRRTGPNNQSTFSKL